MVEDNNRNSGYRNSGYRNSGDGNSGNGNSGYRNSGYRNSGDWNSGDWNSGYFNTETPVVTFFDQPVEGMTHEEARGIIPWIELPISCEWVPKDQMSDQEKEQNQNFEVVGGYLKKIHVPVQEAFPKVWDTMTKEERQKWLNLPNFDAEKFLKCTGVDVRETEKPVPTVVVIEGRKYQLIDD